MARKHRSNNKFIENREKLKERKQQVKEEFIEKKEKEKQNQELVVLQNNTTNNSLEGIVASFTGALQNLSKTFSDSFLELYEDNKIMREDVNYLLERDEEANNYMSDVQFGAVDESMNKMVEQILRELHLDNKPETEFFRKAISKICFGKVKHDVGVGKWEDLKATDYKRIMNAIIPALPRTVKKSEVMKRAERYMRTERIKAENTMSIALTQLKDEGYRLVKMEN